MPSSGSGSASAAVSQPSGAGARRSLLFIRRLLAKELHSLALVTTSNAGAAAGTSIIASQLVNAIDSGRYLHVWVMPTEGSYAGQIRRVRAESALNLTTGELQTSAFGGQIVSGIDVEIHRLLPPDDDDGWTGLRSHINAALREMWTTQRLAIVGVEGAPSYSLSAYEDWLDPMAVRELRRSAVASTLNPMPHGTHEAVRNADGLSLQIAPTLPSSDASTLEVFRPTDTWIKTAGVWAASSAGLVNDTDECLLQPDLVVTVALAHAYNALAAGPDGARYDDRARKQRLRANVLKMLELDHTQRRVGSNLGTGTGWTDRPFDFKDGSSW